MIKYVGPVMICKIIDPHNYLLMTLNGKILRGFIQTLKIKNSHIKKQ